jgi:hypothetical protein
MTIKKALFMQRGLPPTFPLEVEFAIDPEADKSPIHLIGKFLLENIKPDSLRLDTRAALSAAQAFQNEFSKIWIVGCPLTYRIRSINQSTMEFVAESTTVIP